LAALPTRSASLIASVARRVGRSEAPILIDQEGGRVARLGPPHWRRYPSAALFGSLPDPRAQAAARLGARLIADDLGDLGNHRRLFAGARSSDPRPRIR